METIILAGGYGTRIVEETITKPKPMIEIGGKPILWHIMKTYSNYGHNDFIICLGYKSNYVKEYFILMSEKNLLNDEINLPNFRVRKILRDYLSKNKALYNYYIKFILSIKRVKIFIRQILVLLKSAKYRKYITKKIYSKLN